MNEDNVLSVNGLSEDVDPTRFLSVHCFLFPGSIKECGDIQQF